MEKKDNVRYISKNLNRGAKVKTERGFWNHRLNSRVLYLIYYIKRTSFTIVSEGDPNLILGLRNNIWWSGMHSSGGG